MKIMPALLTLPLLLSVPSYAEFGEKLNCRTVKTGDVKMYSGTASCSTSAGTISQYVFPTASQQTWISDYIGGSWHSCLATVPFLGFEEVTKTVCDYKPVSSISISHDEDPSATVTAYGRDYDGSIGKVELWVDGVLQSGNSVKVQGHNYQRFQLRARVTDDDGYTHETSTSVLVKFEPLKCGRYLC